jgi:hypothetical protein
MSRYRLETLPGDQKLPMQLFARSCYASSNSRQGALMDGAVILACGCDDRMIAVSVLFALPGVHAFQLHQAGRAVRMPMQLAMRPCCRIAFNPHCSFRCSK